MAYIELDEKADSEPIEPVVINDFEEYNLANQFREDEECAKNIERINQENEQNQRDCENFCNDFMLYSMLGGFDN